MAASLGSAESLPSTANNTKYRQLTLETVQSSSDKEKKQKLTEIKGISY